MKNKLLTFFLALAASVGILFAQSGTCGTNLTWTLEDGTLTISGNGAMTNYSLSSLSSRAPWDSYKESIRKVIIEDGVKNIGDYAFYYCEILKSITIPNSVTTIGDHAFYYCYNLKSIGIPNSVTSIGDYTFYDCHNLTSITIPNSVTSIGQSAFRDCSRLTSVTIPNSVISIEDYTFYGCSGLTSVTIPNGVTSIGDYAFCECSSLTSVTIGNSVTSIGQGAFARCTISKIYFSGTMEEWCAKSFSPSSISSSYTLYINGEAVTNAVIPNSVTSIEDYTFYGCSGLTSVTIPNGVTSIGDYAFCECSSLTSITIPNSVATIGKEAFRGCSSIKNVSIASSVKVLERSAFYNCSNIETITCYGMRPPTVNTNALYGLSYSTIVYVPADYLETYQMHEQWGLYDVRALENSGTEPATYTITWQDEDGNVIKTDEVAQGTTPVFTGTTPTKEGYTFAGWLPNIKPATKNICYTTYFIPTQQQESKVYTVNINGENCSLNINNQYPEGTVITLEAVADECFEFRQWSDGNKDNPRTVTVTKDMSLTAEFNKVRYTVTGETSTGGQVQIRKQ